MTTETNVFGKYIFPNIAENNDFNFVPRKPGYDFAPPNYSVSSLNQDKVLNFTGFYITYPIKDKITFQGNLLTNMAVNLTAYQPGSTVTDINKDFSFTVSKYGDYKVRPTLNGYIFAPRQVTFNSVTNSLRTDFAAREGFAIGRKILRNGIPPVGVTVNLSGSKSQTRMINSDGLYSFDAGAGDNYQVMPFLENLGFTLEPFLFES
ncbi:MAG TPA: hypothetical protein VK308_01275 [Pyrinomonadaceae bacterium]|nr:hypothetical protein [Pyrinomonadaceae bacterium]